MLNSCLLFFSMLNQLDYALVSSVISLESSFNPKAEGRHEDSGLMQIRHIYVPYTRIQLLQPCTNIMVGTDILRKAREKFPLYKDYQWVSAYNLGHSGFRKIKYPELFPYYLKVKEKLNDRIK